MKTLELFSGTKSFSKIASELGHETFTVDNDPSLKPDFCGDIRNLSGYNLFTDFWMSTDILWASPPCLGRNWTGGKNEYIPKSESAELSIELAEKTLDLIDDLKPRYWFIENPRGLLRKMDFMDEFLKDNGGVRHTITYCQYSDTRQKPTDIWTNCLTWKPRPMCKPGASCHEAAPRGSRTGTQGLKGAKERGAIPAELFREIFDCIKQ